MSPKFLKTIIYIGTVILLSLTLIGWSAKYVWGLTLLGSLISALFLLSTIFENKMAVEKKPVPWPIMLFILMLPINLFFSSNLNNSLTGVIKFYLCFFAFWIFYKLTDNAKKIEKFSLLFLILGAITAIYAIWEFFQYQDPSFGLASLFGWRNTYAGFLTLVIPIAWFFYFQKKGKILSFIYLIANGLLLTALYLTFSQAAWLAIIVVFAITLVIYLIQKNKKSFIFRLIILVLTTIVFTFGLLIIHQKVGTGSSNTTNAQIQGASAVAPIAVETRLIYWNTSWKMFKNNALQGVGLGNFSDFYTRYLDTVWGLTTTPHNFLILLAVETGIIIFLAFLAVFLYLFWITLKTLKSAFRKRKNLDDPQQKMYLLFFGLIGSLAASFIHNLMDFDWEIFSILLIWWILLGLAISLNKIIKAQPAYATAPIPHQVRDKLQQESKRQGLFDKTIYPIKIAAGFSVFFLLFCIALGDKYNVSGEDNLKEYGQGQQAVNNFKQAIVYNPLNPLYHENSARGWWDMVLSHTNDRNQNLANAIKEAEKAVKLAPDSAHQNYFLGQIYYYTQNPENIDKAINSVKKSIGLDWHDPEYYFLLANLYNEQGKKKEALDALNKPLEIYTDEAKKKIIFFQQFNDSMLEQALMKINLLKISIENELRGTSPQ